MTKQIVQGIIATAMFIGGFALLWFAAGWQVALGVFLVLWGHCAEKHLNED